MVGLTPAEQAKRESARLHAAQMAEQAVSPAQVIAWRTYTRTLGSMPHAGRFRGSKHCAVYFRPRVIPVASQGGVQCGGLRQREAGTSSPPVQLQPQPRCSPPLPARQ
jgi:hypothetical protein